MTDLATKLAEALRCYVTGDEFNERTENQLYNQAREALRLYDEVKAHPVQDLPPLPSQFEALLGVYWQAGYDEGTGHQPEVDPNETLSRIRQEVRDYARAAMAAHACAACNGTGQRTYFSNDPEWPSEEGPCDLCDGTGQRAATPAPAPQPLTDERIWSMKEMNGWHAADHYRLVRVVRAVERAHGIGKEASNG